MTSLSLLTGRAVGECLLMSSLPGKSLRMLVDRQGLPSDSTCVLKAEPGKLNIKRFYLSVYLLFLFKLAILT